MAADNSSSLSVDQGNRNSNDEACFRRIFPEEIWLRILNHLSPSSMETMLCSQPFFRRLLLPTRHEFLFPKVWKVFATKVETELLPSYNTREEIGGVSRVINPIVEIVQSARLVSKDWCRVIDNFYDNLERRLDFRDFDQHARHRVGDWIQFNHFYHGASLVRFVRHFQSTHAATERNPFLGRRLSLKLPQIIIIHEVADYLGRFVGQLFQDYGRHIWYLEVITDRDLFYASACYSNLKQWLELTPNLKSFKWTLTGEFRHRELENLPISTIPHIRQDPGILPFPRLEQLKLLHVGVPQILAEHLITVNNHVEVIEYCGHVPINLNIMMLPRLKKVHLLRGRLEDLEGLERAEANGWKLEALRLDMSDQCWYISYERILSIVEIWKDSLVTVELSLAAARRMKDLKQAFESMKGARSSLPKVKKFTLALRNTLGIDYVFPDSADKHSQQWKATEGFQIFPEEGVEFQVIHFQWDAGITSETFGIQGWKNFPTMGKLIGVQVPPDMYLQE